MVASPAATPTVTMFNSTSKERVDAVLPSPEVFDIVPALHELLSRMLPPTEDLSRPPSYSNQPTLSPQYLQAEASSIRSKIRKAREAVAALPDVDRSIEQQEEEITMLTEKIEKQRRVLRALADGSMAS